MSTATRFRGPDPDRAPNTLQRLWNYAVHHPQVAAALLIVSCILEVYGLLPYWNHPTALWWPGHTRTHGVRDLPLSDAANWASTTFLFLSTYLNFKSERHFHSPCDLCIMERVLLDGPARAEEQLKSLRLFHRLSGFWGWTARLRAYARSWRSLAFLGMAWLLLLMAGFLAAQALIPSPYSALAYWLPLGVFNVLTPIVTARHRLLQQWCPWCRHGGGDDQDLIEPSPEPSGEIVPSLPSVHV